MGIALAEPPRESSRESADRLGAITDGGKTVQSRSDPAMLLLLGAREAAIVVLCKHSSVLSRRLQENRGLNGLR